ncbi:tetratricopeptide repeat protein [Chloroflexota bacterium]
MQAKNIAIAFDDAPTTKKLEAVISGWQRPEPPNRLGNIASAFGAGGEGIIRRRLSKIKSRRYKSQLEVKLIDWLYDFIRANIMRGRIFDLREVLRDSSADCLGYTKLFTLLGRLLGLDAGVIEVIIDNKGRYVPHTAVLVRLSNHQLRFVDLWYGSKNIKHRRLGLQVKQGRAWKIEDIELPELHRLEEVSYLPDSCVNAITLYIQGNQYLGRQEFGSAIKCYSKAIKLYPGNARLFYNRAIAYVNLGERAKADADYTWALSNDAAIMRILAKEHDAVTSLLNLDAHGIDDLAQEMYLLHNGFSTGKEVALEHVAKRFGLPETETAAILSSTETKIATDLD